jgi:sodium/hydrogen exchanger 10/11
MIILSQVLFHTAGIVMWTLILNATTTKYILRFLKLNDISSSRYKTISLAVSRVKETKARAVSLLKSDRFLADADWDIVESRVQISNPYKHVKSSVVNVKALEANCSSCSHRITYPLTPQEKAELSEQLRNRIIQLEKTSYWRQFEQGMLSGEAVRILMSLADTVLDKPDRLIEFKDIVSHWHIPRIFSIIPQYIVWIFVKLKITHPPPKNKLLLLFYKVGEHPLFVWSIYIPVLINLLCIILQLAIMGNHTLTTVLEAFNYFFCFVYIVEEIIKMMAFRLYYWLDWWNLIDLAVLCVAIIDIVVYLVVEDEIKVTVLLYVRFILAARLIKLIQLVLPISVKIIEYMINRWLRLGYDIGRGFVVGEEEVLNQFDSFKLVHEPTASKFKQRIETTKLNIIKSMNLIRQKHPGIALSVKTHHAARTILNQCQDTVKTMFSNGILEEIDADKLLLDIENKTKKLEFGSITMAPLDTDRLLFHLQWLDGVDIDAVATLKQYTVLRQYDTGNCLIKVGDVPDGAYIIISGIVKVVVPSSHNPNDPDQILDFLGAGSLVGEMAILKKNTLRTASVICETDIQAFYISKDDLWKVLEQFPVLENKLWKIFGVRIAITLLSKLPQYQEWSTSKLTIMCENSYIISMSDDETVKVFDITKDMKEVIVIEGEASCPATGEIITSPAVISRNIKSLKIVRISTRLLVTAAECTDGSIDVASAWAVAEAHHHQNKHHPTGRTGLTSVLRKPFSYWHQFTHRVSETWNDLMHVELHHNGRIFPQTISGEEEFINVTLTRSPLDRHVDNPVTIETITQTTAIN